MTPEGKLKAEVRVYLNELKAAGVGVYYRMPVPVGYGTQGLDFEGCIRGRFFAIETKAPGKMPTARQNLTLDAINRAGGIAFYADNIERVKRYIEDHYLGKYNPPRG